MVYYYLLKIPWIIINDITLTTLSTIHLCLAFKIVADSGYDGIMNLITYFKTRNETNTT